MSFLFSCIQCVEIKLNILGPTLISWLAYLVFLFHREFCCIFLNLLFSVSHVNSCHNKTFHCGAICSKHDQAYKRWMPHINLLYPFIMDDVNGEAFSMASKMLTPVLAEISPFSIRFDVNSFRYFKHGKNCTLWLKPQSETTLQSGEMLVQCYCCSKS